MRRLPAAASLLMLSLVTGCVSVRGAEPPATQSGPLPSAERPRCGDLVLELQRAFNGEEEADEGEGNESVLAERRALTALLVERVTETRLVGYLGQEELEGSLLKLKLRRDVKASFLHGAASGLTLFLFPYWVEITYELSGEIYEAESVVSSSRAEASWFVVAHPFLVFAYPFDEPTDLAALVDGMAVLVLSDLVQGESE